MEDRDPIQTRAANELTPALRSHLQEVLIQQGVPDEVRQPMAMGSAGPGQPHVVGAGLPGLGSLSGLLSSAAVRYVVGMALGMVQAEVMPPLMAALAQVKAQHPDFNPDLILEPINQLLAYLGGRPVTFQG